MFSTKYKNIYAQIKEPRREERRSFLPKKLVTMKGQTSLAGYCSLHSCWPLKDSMTPDKTYQKAVIVSSDGEKVFTTSPSYTRRLISSKEPRMEEWKICCPYADIQVTPPFLLLTYAT
ncbi:uncharacterized protein LOC144240579 [Crocuta crocuta]